MARSIVANVLVIAGAAAGASGAWLLAPWLGCVVVGVLLGVAGILLAGPQK